jgi:hypothetical protein
MVREAGLEPACLSTRDFKSLEYTISPLSQLTFGVPPGTRTPTNGFGDRYTAIILMRLNLAETVRFELTVPFDTTVFKTVAISQTRPRFLYLVAGPGIEPRSEAYETSELPLLYPAILGVGLPPTPTSF